MEEIRGGDEDDELWRALLRLLLWMLEEEVMEFGSGMEALESMLPSMDCAEEVLISVLDNDVGMM